MTTIAQLDKYADKWFNDQMRRRGFAVEKKFVFWRKRGPLYDMFIPQILTGGELLRINVTIWSPWADQPDGALGKFPPASCLIGGTLSDEFPEQMHGGMLFEVEDEKNIDASLKQILALIDKHILPWFPTVNSYESYAAYIGDRGFHPTEEYQAKLKLNMARAFELEEFL
jgi:hypothetical protein